MAKMKTLTVSGQTYTVNDPEAVSFEQPQALTARQQQIARDNIGIPSEKQIIDRLSPCFAASGSTVICEPVAAYPLEVVSNLAPADVPYTAVNLIRCGKNLLRFHHDGTHSGNATVLEQLDNGVVVQGKQGGVSPGQNAYSNGWYNYKNFNYARGIEQVFSFDITVLEDPDRPDNIIGAMYMTVNFNMSGGSVNATQAHFRPAVGKKTRICIPFTSSKDCEGLYFTFTTCSATLRLENFQIELGDTATDYAPFTGFDAYTTDLEETVYGGSFNWSTGVLTDPNGITYQLTPQQIPGLPGTNYLHSDTGDTVVTGRLDPGKIMDKLHHRIATLEAAILSNI